MYDRGGEKATVTLRNFTADDRDVLLTHYGKGRTPDEVEALIADWAKKEVENRYFEMFAVVHEGTIVGSISLYHHSEHVISCGPEIFPDYRRQGFGQAAMIAALETAKEKGYRIALHQIRTDNAASIGLHEHLGFETDGYVYRNRRGREVLIYVKGLE